MVRERYKEIYKLRNMLDNAQIPYIFENSLFNGCAIAYPNRHNLVCSVIEHDLSYGSEIDKIEIMGLLTDEEKKYGFVVGYLSADEVFSRITTHEINILNKGKK